MSLNIWSIILATAVLYPPDKLITGVRVAHTKVDSASTEISGLWPGKYLTFSLFFFAFFFLLFSISLLSINPL